MGGTWAGPQGRRGPSSIEAALFLCNSACQSFSRTGKLGTARRPLWENAPSARLPPGMLQCSAGMARRDGLSPPFCSTPAFPGQGISWTNRHSWSPAVPVTSVPTPWWNCWAPGMTWSFSTTSATVRRRWWTASKRLPAAGRCWSRATRVIAARCSSCCRATASMPPSTLPATRPWVNRWPNRWPTTATTSAVPWCCSSAWKRRAPAASCSARRPPSMVIRPACPFAKTSLPVRPTPMAAPSGTSSTCSTTWRWPARNGPSASCATSTRWGPMSRAASARIRAAFPIT